MVKGFKARIFLQVGNELMNRVVGSLIVPLIPSWARRMVPDVMFFKRRIGTCNSGSPYRKNLKAHIL